MSDLAQARLYGILDTGYCGPVSMPAMAEKMIRGGVDIVQLRAKHLHSTEIGALAAQLVPIFREANIPFGINDYPEIAGEVGADFVHVGQDDLGVEEARELGGGSLFVGKSTHSVAQALAARLEGADYIGFGPLFATPTKPDYKPIGIEEIRDVHATVNLPIFCIGGIKRENFEQVLAAGAKRIVVVSGILQAEDVVGYCRELKAGLTH